MTSIFDSKTPAALDEYLQLASKYKAFDVERARALALTAIRYYAGDAARRTDMMAGQALERRWYDSLQAGTPDYAVYDDEFFVSDIWACWIVYSRKYLHAFRSTRLTKGGGTHAQELFDDCATVADLGCGIGYTTAALTELMPWATVIGTQIAGSFQYAVAQEVGTARGFALQPALTRQADLIFASEYFEHFQQPIEHLLEVLVTAKPKVLVIANSFGARSIGHFDMYQERPDQKEHRLVETPNTLIGRHFNETLRNMGYSQVFTRFWNNRPTVWRKNS